MLPLRVKLKIGLPAMPPSFKAERPMRTRQDQLALPRAVTPGHPSILTNRQILLEAFFTFFLALPLRNDGSAIV
jgi:hypothetical protein